MDIYITLAGILFFVILYVIYLSIQKLIKNQEKLKTEIKQISCQNQGNFLPVPVTDTSLQLVPQSNPPVPKDDIKSITLKQDNNEITFSKTNKILPSEITISNYNVLSASSALTGGALQISPLLHQMATKGIYEASVSPALLTKFNNGLTSTMIQNSTNGQIMAHAGFSSAATKIATPMIVFQVASIITGLYYLNVINNNFKRISGNINDLKRFTKHDKLAELENISNQLKNLYAIKHPQTEHLMLLEMLASSTGTLKQYFIKEVQHFGTKDNTPKSFFVNKQIELLQQNLYYDDFAFNIKMLAAAEEIEQIIQIISLSLNCKHINTDSSFSRKEHIGEIIEKIKNWDISSSFINTKGKEINNKYYGSILEQLNNANAWNASNEKRLNDFKNQITKIKNEISNLGKFDVIRRFQADLDNFMNKTQQIILLKDDNDNDVFLVKN